MTSSGGYRALAAFVAFIALGAVGVSPATSAPPPPSEITVFNTPPDTLHGYSLSVYGTGQADSVEVSLKNVRYTISSPDGVAISDSSAGCESESPTEVNCVLFSGHRVVVATNLGNDHVDLHGPVRSESRGEVGADWIDGSPAHNALSGDSGDDRLAGRGGDDVLRGGVGRDALFGNAGNDRLLAADGERDRLIACGPGEDKVIVDWGKTDPDPIGCERVIHRRA